MYFDAFFLVSYGGPEGPEDVHPFLDRILAGKPIPAERKKMVVDKYMACGGFSPLNGQCRQFMRQMANSLKSQKIKTYQANLYSPPFVPDVVKHMKSDGVRRVLLMISSPFGSVIGCRRYLDVIQRDWPTEIDWAKIPCFFDHPLYLKAAANCLLSCTAQVILDSEDRALPAPSTAPLPEWHETNPDFETTSIGVSQTGHSPPRTLFLFTAHALPLNQAQAARYSGQIRVHCREVLRMAHALQDRELAPAITQIAFQSRSGNPHEPWTEPNIYDTIIECRNKYPSLRNIIVTPCGFMFENMEITWDLDVELRRLCERLDLRYYRTQTAGMAEETVRMCTEYLFLSRDKFRPCPCSPGICDYSCSDSQNTPNIS